MSDPAIGTITNKALETSNNTVHSIVTPATIAAGTFLWLAIQYAGANTNSLTTDPVGFTKWDDITTSGATMTLYYKQNAGPANQSQTITATCSGTGRVAMAIIPVVNVTTTGGSSAFDALKGSSSVTASINTPSFVATRRGLVIELVGWSVTGQVANSGKTIPDLTAGPLQAAGGTNIFRHWTGSATTTGNAELGGATFGIANSGDTVGGHTWTPESPPPATAGNAVRATILMPTIVAPSTVVPDAVTTSTGWTAVNAASILAAITNSDPTQYAESGDNPDGSQPLHGTLPDLNPDETITVTVQAKSSAGTLTNCAVQIRQGPTTVVAQITGQTLTTTLAPYTVPATPLETATITDWTNLEWHIIADVS